LLSASADPKITGDLDIAVWCDLIVTGLTDGLRTYLDEPLNPAVLGLLAWATAGLLPDHYRPHARSGPLLPPSDVMAIADAASRLASETHPGTKHYGAAVSAALLPI